MSLVFDSLPYSEIHDKIKDLYKEVYGKSGLEEFHEGVSSLKEMLKKKTGINIDVSNFDPNDSLEEALCKLAESMEGVMDGNKNKTPPPPKQKSKKELLKEKKALELETLQNKGLSTIYKRLVKELHPDLEQDPEKRVEKDILMKRLTAAYENQDLLSLLALESEWMQGVDSSSETLNEETLKIYNSLLKDQIEDLKKELFMVGLHPRYIEIHNYIQDFPEKPLNGIGNALSDYEAITEQYSSRLEDVSGKNPLQSLKKGLAVAETFSGVDPEVLDALEMLALFEGPKISKKKSFAETGLDELD